uniref:Putative uncharacterized protein YDR544C n=1 Tax=Saccharomyces cerevisiae (strain ATCC 204508 / S288c) TaxID=559292 RepID=YD544_YEAST|nr:RecName: Full=Putative uncharacterized protein YDR544C [Saccharomyces cerevisiae S288C]AAB64986.1 Ydr544cp [Saccharomyces cerevisiae]
MSLRPCLTPSSMQYSDIYIHTTPHPHTPHHTHHTHTTPTPTPHPHTHTPTPERSLSLRLRQAKPDQPVSQITLHYPTSPLVTLTHSTIPPQPPSISLCTTTNRPSTITVTLQLPISNSTTTYPTISHLLLTILLFYPPLLKR